ncbi:MAG TPA: PAS domain S-box protein [bacterium]|nr:PAS domain S-box protein [bacterium]
MGTTSLMDDPWNKDGDPMITPIRVLILEDTPADAELMVRELRDAGFTPSWERVDTEEGFLTQLAFAPDIILADYALPRCNGLRALRLLRQLALEIPCILVSGTIGEETAISCLHEGAVDYILKDRMTRLGQAVTRALEQKRLHDGKQATLAALRQSEERFRGLIEHSTDGIVLIEPAGTIRYASPSITGMLGHLPEQLAERPLFNLVHPEDLPQAKAAIVRVLERSGANLPIEARLRHSDGAWRWCEGTQTNLLATSGVEAIVVNFRDVTERREADATRARLAAIVDSSDDAIISTALDGTILTWNAGAERTYGYTACEVAGRPISLLMPPARVAEVSSVLERVGTGEHLRHFQTVWKHKDGTLLDVSLTLSPLLDAPGRVSGISAVARDVTTLRRAEELLRIRARQQEVVAYIGRSALAGVDFDVLSAEAVSLVAQALRVGHCMVLEVHAEQRAVVVRAGVRSPGATPDSWVLALAEAAFEGCAQLYDGPCIIEDVRENGHNEVPLLSQLGAQSGVSVPIRSSGPAYGILGAYSVQPRPYTRTDVAFLQAVANVLAACWEYRGAPEVRRKIEEIKLPSGV